MKCQTTHRNVSNPVAKYARRVNRGGFHTKSKHPKHKPDYLEEYYDERNVERAYECTCRGQPESDAACNCNAELVWEPD